MSLAQQSAIERLRQTVEKAITRKMRTPKDFDFLSERIFDKLHQNVSATTLKRIWGYLQYRRMNELRITFMKDLVDTGYVFLGVYRLSLTHSDTARCVWERVADEVDLRDLDRLEKLR